MTKEAIWWEIMLFILAFVAGYLVIFVAADKLIDNLCDAAKLWKISPFLIGLLIIGIDPEECIASIIAAIQDLPHIAIGNIIGNNIIAMTLCFSIPMLFLSKKNLEALCNLKNINTSKSNTDQQKQDKISPLKSKSTTNDTEEIELKETEEKDNDSSSSDAEDPKGDNQKYPQI